MLGAISRFLSAVVGSVKLNDVDFGDAVSALLGLAIARASLRDIVAVLQLLVGADDAKHSGRYDGAHHLTVSPRPSHLCNRRDRILRNVTLFCATDATL